MLQIFTLGNTRTSMATHTSPVLAFGLTCLYLTAVSTSHGGMSTWSPKCDHYHVPFISEVYLQRIVLFCLWHFAWPLWSCPSFDIIHSCVWRILYCLFPLEIVVKVTIIFLCQFNNLMQCYFLFFSTQILLHISYSPSVKYICICFIFTCLGHSYCPYISCVVTVFAMLFVRAQVLFYFCE